MNYLSLFAILSLFINDKEVTFKSNHVSVSETSVNVHKDSLKYPPCVEEEIPHYTAHRVYKAPKIDGKLDDVTWQRAPRSPRFRDLIHGNETIHDTRAAVLWDEEYLYVAYWIEEPNVEATLTKRDALIYNDNDVEFFIAGKDAYYEFEINSFGTIYEVFFIWEQSETYKNGGFDGIPELTADQPGRRSFPGVGYQPHPRGSRIGYWKWDFPGLKSAVHVDGTINNNKDRDRGWTVELAIPWSGMSAIFVGDDRSVPPLDKDVWQMDFSRFNQYKEAPPAQDPGGWAWSPHGVWDSHVPECYTYIHFSESQVPDSKNE
jgi:hypothetical protein